MHDDLLTSIGICIIAAALLGYAANRLKQPLILAYLVAGMLIGPEVGFRLVTEKDSIHTVAEIGLILLLFIIGLEIDLKKLLAAGKPVILVGLLQFPLCVGLAMLFFALWGYRVGNGDFSLLYLGLCLGLSSTMIVVKLLYDKFELDTLPGRITLGILIFQDIWAIVVLAIQPNLLNPTLGPLMASLVKGFLLVIVSLGVSRYVLPALFRSVAKHPEVLLILSLAWCFLVCAGAHFAGLSREMGALIAGVTISSLPYNVDVIAKVVSIRDFFVTLFFVALGMQIPMPSLKTILLALAGSLFLVGTRFFTIFPMLRALRLGHRVSLLPAINLAQMSEFSMVIAAIALAMAHIETEVVAVLIFIFAITSTASTYMINYSHPLYEWLNRRLLRLGMRDLGTEEGAEAAAPGKEVVMLGFFHAASSLVHEFELCGTKEQPHPLLAKLLVIDFNPLVHQELNRRGISCVYGDIAHMETLHHVNIHDAKLVVSTITDAILKGTDNLRLLKQVRRLCPHAGVVVTAQSIRQALELYHEGADYVYVPRLQSACELATVIEQLLHEGCERHRDEQLRLLRLRNEVLA